MGSIDWIPIAGLPDALKDGREVLIAQPNTLGTRYGGDGNRLSPERPYMVEIATWGHGRWEVYAGHDTDYVLPGDVTHFAEINPPT